VLGVVAVAMTAGVLARRGTAGPEHNEAQAERTAPAEAATSEAEKPAEPAAAGTAQPKAEDRRQLLETVGALSAVHAFQTYLNLGLIADGKAKGTYTDRDARKMLDSVLGLQDCVDQKLSALAKTDLDKQDRNTLDDMRTLSDLLRKQGKELEAYWDSGKPEDEARYESVRKDTWAVLNRLMGPP
jgi:hypothetical protein